MGHDSNKWISILFALLLVSFLMSCTPEEKSQQAVLSTYNNLQSDGYGHIDDTVLYEIPEEEYEEEEREEEEREVTQTTCEDTKKEPKELVCPDGKKVYLCHIPPGNPLNAHVIKVSINSLKGHKNHDGDFPLRCGDDLEVGQNCPYIPPCDDSDSNTDDNNGDGDDANSGDGDDTNQGDGDDSANGDGKTDETSSGSGEEEYEEPNGGYYEEPIVNL